MSAISPPDDPNGASARPDASRPDIVVAGAGYVGLSVAVAIKQAAPGLEVVVVDAAPDGVWERDTRASAVAAAAVRMLGELGVWPEIAGEAEPIREMIVTDSRTADPVRPVFPPSAASRRRASPSRAWCRTWR